ncbi:uncharacterized protein LOC132544683 [Ylistrum balloti]|uniref:uncharacterized protein LOC132544683 n=1 Tax=Ylistrum balloti TaxID=509963 RepID=UPI0029058EA4|nr:uncharacterized protein LOC132544683 [Ylistrum balloti]
MSDMLNIVALPVVLVYITAVVMWFSPDRVFLLNTKLRALQAHVLSDVKKNWTAFFITLGLCFWMTALQIDSNNTKNTLMNIETKVVAIEEYLESNRRDMKAMERHFETLLETELHILRSECRNNLQDKIQKLNNKILLKLRDTDAAVGDLVLRVLEIEWEVRKNRDIFRSIKDYFKEDGDKTYQLEKDVDRLYQLYNQFVKERDETRFHERKGNEYQRNVVRNNDGKNVIVTIIDTALNILVGGIGKSLAGMALKAVSWAGSWIGIT